MRRIKILCAAMLALTASATLTAQKAEIRGYLALWGEGGYAALQHNVAPIAVNSFNFNVSVTDNPELAKGTQLLKVASPISGYGGGLGIGYEFHYNAFIAKIGVEGTFWKLGHTFDDFDTYLEGMYDTEDSVMTGVFSMRKNTDKYQIAYANVPLMLGFHLSKKIYFLAGAKYGLNVYGSSTVASTVTNYGLYNTLIGDATSIVGQGNGILGELVKDGGHGYATHERKKTTPISFKNNLAASMEIGFYLTPNYLQEVMYRVALFADYGLMNIHTNKMAPATSQPPVPEGAVLQNVTSYATITDNGPRLAYEPLQNPLLLQSAALNKAFMPLFGGVKFTVLFKLHENSICNCEWY